MFARTIAGLIGDAPSDVPVPPGTPEHDDERSDERQDDAATGNFLQASLPPIIVAPPLAQPTGSSVAAGKVSTKDDAIPATAGVPVSAAVPEADPALVTEPSVAEAKADPVPIDHAPVKPLMLDERASGPGPLVGNGTVDVAVPPAARAIDHLSEPVPSPSADTAVAFVATRPSRPTIASMPAAMPIPLRFQAYPTPDAPSIAIQTATDRHAGSASAPVPVSPPLATSTTAAPAAIPAPAGIAIAAAPLPAGPRARRLAVDEAAESADAPIFASAVPATGHHAVVAVADAQHVPLDMGDARWPRAMLDRIEQIRDAADANGTRIRLTPDALGSIQVSVKQSGDALQVRFVAEQPATAAMIQDAQPQLADLARARGLTLDQGSAGAGTTGQGWRQQPQPMPTPLPDTPPGAVTTETTGLLTAGRLA